MAKTGKVKERQENSDKNANFEDDNNIITNKDITNGTKGNGGKPEGAGDVAENTDGPHTDSDGQTRQNGAEAEGAGEKRQAEQGGVRPADKSGERTKSELVLEREGKGNGGRQEDAGTSEAAVRGETENTGKGKGAAAGKEEGKASLADDKENVKGDLGNGAEGNDKAGNAEGNGETGGPDIRPVSTEPTSEKPSDGNEGDGVQSQSRGGEDVQGVLGAGGEQPLNYRSREVDDIIDSARKNNTLGTAPNGKKSNLFEKFGKEVWAKVRTKAFKDWFGDWERSEVADYLLGDNFVKELTGDEFKDDGSPLVDRIADYYEKNYGSKVTREGFGDVRLDKRGIRDDIQHGLRKNKAAAFAAIPEVIMSGRIIDRQDNWKDRGYSSVTFAAPIKIGSGQYICTVVVTKGAAADGFRVYLHKVNSRKNLPQGLPNTGFSPDITQEEGIAKVLNNILSSKENSSKVVDENGEPLVVFHGSRYGGGFSEFDYKPAFFSDNENVSDLFRNESDYGTIQVNDGYIDIDLDRRDLEDITQCILGKGHTPIELSRLGKIDWSDRNIINDEAREAILEIINRDGDYSEDDLKTVEFSEDYPLYECFLNIRNPLVLDFEGRYWGEEDQPEDHFDEVFDGGYDGMIVKNIIEGSEFLRNGKWNDPSTDYIVFDPNQIKSRENEGGFSKSNNNINYRSGKKKNESKGLKQPDIETDDRDPKEVEKELGHNGEDDVLDEEPVKEEGAFTDGNSAVAKVSDEYAAKWEAKRKAHETAAKHEDRRVAAINKAAEKDRENLTRRYNAMKAVTQRLWDIMHDLWQLSDEGKRAAALSATRSLKSPDDVGRHVRTAMAAQRNYDRATLESLLNLVGEMNKAGFMTTMGTRDINKVLNIIKNAIGTAQTSTIGVQTGKKAGRQFVKAVDELFTMLANAQDNLAQKELEKILNVKADRQNPAGVSVVLLLKFSIKYFSICNLLRNFVISIKKYKDEDIHGTHDKRVFGSASRSKIGSARLGCKS